jgi:hypothetical protein
MNIWKKLQNPFALVGQGFVLGGVLFFATHADSISAAPAPTAATTAQRRPLEPRRFRLAPRAILSIARSASGLCGRDVCREKPVPTFSHIAL